MLSCTLSYMGLGSEGGGSSSSLYPLGPTEWWGPPEPCTHPPHQRWSFCMGLNLVPQKCIWKKISTLLQKPRPADNRKCSKSNRHAIRHCKREESKQCSIVVRRFVRCSTSAESSGSNVSIDTAKNNRIVFFFLLNFWLRTLLLRCRFCCCTLPRFRNEIIN